MNPELMLLAAMAALAVAALVAIVALIVHARIAGRAVERARREDLPQIVATSGTTLSSLLNVLRKSARSHLPVKPSEQQSATPTLPAPGLEDATGDGRTGQ